ncbi:hypothetical protein [Microbacterium yannicii]|uniref:hypothetical protein n=1 Tax=Microbacterium yannicii TaxID=671622 RepID=UPI0012F9A222|nr:hypothetical protein [Microbacterium yannicii]
MTRAPVWTQATSHMGVLGRLAGTLEQVPGPSGAICVLDGDEDWTERALELAGEGAVALVVADPAAVSGERIHALQRAGTPVVLDRPRLPPDLPALGNAASRMHIFVADVVSVAADGLAATRDAVGWVRLLAGEGLGVDGAAHTAVATIATGRTASGAPVSLSITQAADGVRPAFEILAIGPERTEVRIDDATLERRIRVVGGDGTREPRPHWETGLRLALRRAVASLSGAPPTDLADLHHDAAGAGAILGMSTAI